MCSGGFVWLMGGGCAYVDIVVFLKSPSQARSLRAVGAPRRSAGLTLTRDSSLSGGAVELGVLGLGQWESRLACFRPPLPRTLGGPCSILNLAILCPVGAKVHLPPPPCCCCPHRALTSLPRVLHETVMGGAEAENSGLPRPTESGNMFTDYTFLGRDTAGGGGGGDPLPAC